MSAAPRAASGHPPGPAGAPGTSACASQRPSRSSSGPASGGSGALPSPSTARPPMGWPSGSPIVAWRTWHVSPSGRSMSCGAPPGSGCPAGWRLSAAMQALACAQAPARPAPPQPPACPSDGVNQTSAASTPARQAASRATWSSRPSRAKPRCALSAAQVPRSAPERVGFRDIAESSLRFKRNNKCIECLVLSHSDRNQ